MTIKEKMRTIGIFLYATMYFVCFYGIFQVTDSIIVVFPVIIFVILTLWNILFIISLIYDCWEIKE